jgi:hypothetical protein
MLEGENAAAVDALDELGISPCHIRGHRETSPGNGAQEAAPTLHQRDRYESDICECQSMSKLTDARLMQK